MNVWVCIGSGPSLASEDVAFCRMNGWSLATCNMGYKVAPDCHIFHAMDSAWWELVGDDAIESLSDSCQIWSGSPEHAKQYSTNLLTWDADQGYSDKIGHCHGGKLSGLQLINIVGWMKPGLVLLLGYDNQHTNGEAHWHHDYPEHMKNSGIIDQQEGDYAKMWSTSPFPIVNVSRESNIEGIPRADLYEVPAIIEAGVNARRQTPQILDARGNAIRH